MKKSILIFTAIIFAVTGIMAQTPNQFNYQAVLRNVDGSIIASENVIVNISILQSSASGTSVFDEDHSVTTTAQGLINLIIGSVNTTDIANINWGADSYFIKVGVNGTEMGTSPLLSVPYALYAENCGGTSTHYVGELFGGGIVFSVYDNGQHGLIASLKDLDDGSGTEFSDILEYFEIAESMTDGAGNTAALIAQGPTSGAAKLCDDYSITIDGQTYDDWYLPSTRELYLLCSQDIIIDKILDEDGDETTVGFTQAFQPPTQGRYWSSTQLYLDPSYAWHFLFGYGSTTYASKSNPFKVRAIRAF